MSSCSLRRELTQLGIDQSLQRSQEAFSHKDFSLSYSIANHLIEGCSLDEFQLYAALHDRTWSLIELDRSDEVRDSIQPYLARLGQQWMKDHLQIPIIKSSWPSHRIPCGAG